MRLHDLRPQEGSRKKRKRVGRGQASGLGTTAGRGMNGQNSRSGGGVRPGFEGGQMPLFRRIPKRGFNNKRFARNYAEVNLIDLNRFSENTEVTPELLIESGIVKNTKNPIKIMAKGDLTVKLVVKANKFTKSAVEAIESAGGKVEVI